MTSPDFSKAERVFHDQLDRGLHRGAQMVVRHGGEVVLDLSRGVGAGMSIGPDTPFMVFSASKALTAFCAHKLLEEGRLAWDAPVAKYWPEFGSRGKEAATVRHVLLHQAGIPVRGMYRQLPLWTNWNLLIRSIARLKAEYPPGTRTAYHMVNFGFIIGELVRRVTGLPFQEYARQAFFEPLGMGSTWFGRRPPITSEPSKLFSGDPQRRDVVFLFNLPWVRRAVIPAAGAHTTARDLSVFYQMLLNGGIYHGIRVLKEETIRAATTLGFEGYDEVQEMAMRWGYGIHLGGRASPKGVIISGMGRGSTVRTFGHFGMGSAMAWGDPETGLVAIHFSNTVYTGENARKLWQELSNAVWESVGLP